MAKASSRKRGSGSAGKQPQPAPKTQEGRTSKNTSKKTTRKTKASLAEVVAVLKDVLSEVRAIRLAVNQQSVVDRHSVTEIAPNPDKPSGGGDSRPEPEVVSQSGDKVGGNAVANGQQNPNELSKKGPESPSPPVISTGESASKTEAAIKAAHQLAFNAGRLKRKHKPLDVLVQFYKRFQEGISEHTRKQLRGVPDDSKHLIGELLHQMGDMKLLEPEELATVTDKAKAKNRHKAPVRSWKLTDLGKAVAEYEKKRREQEATEERTSSTIRGAISSVKSVPDTE